MQRFGAVSAGGYHHHLGSTHGPAGAAASGGSGGAGPPHHRAAQPILTLTPSTGRPTTAAWPCPSSPRADSRSRILPQPRPPSRSARASPDGGGGQGDQLIAIPSSRWGVCLTEAEGWGAGHPQRPDLWRPRRGHRQGAQRQGEARLLLAAASTDGDEVIVTCGAAPVRPPTPQSTLTSSAWLGREVRLVPAPTRRPRATTSSRRRATPPTTSSTCRSSTGASSTWRRCTC